MRKISPRSSREGKSTKNISSKRPLRINSGGNRVTLFAVAMTKTGEDFADIQAQQRQLPERAHRLGSQRFTTARHADQQDSLGAGQPEFPRLFGKGFFALLQPPLQLFQAADITELLRGVIELQNPRLANNLLFFG